MSSESQLFTPSGHLPAEIRMCQNELLDQGFAVPGEVVGIFQVLPKGQLLNTELVGTHPRN